MVQRVLAQANLSTPADRLASNELKPEPLSSPTRILHIITDLSVAGAEMKLYKLLAASDKDRFSHAVLSMRSQGGLREPIIALGVPVYSLGITRTLPNAMSIVRFIRLVWWLRPHLIHGWMYHGNLAAHVAGAIAPSKPIVLWSIHQSLYSFAFEKRLTALVIRLGARISEKVNRIVYVSKASASQHEAVGYARSKSAVVHYGFDTEKFRPSTEARERVRRELGVPRDTLLIGLIGRYHPVKDHATFLRAGAQVAKAQPDAHFLLCGKQVDDRNSSLTSLIRDLGLTQKVHLLGERRDIEQIIAALDVLASSSCSEGFPNVIGEAMACGVPCVATAVSDLPEIIGDTGHVVPPGDPAALAAAVSEIIEMGNVARQALGESARARVIERYSLELSVTRYEAMYDSLLNLVSEGTQPNLLLSQESVGGET